MLGRYVRDNDSMACGMHTGCLRRGEVAPIKLASTDCDSDFDFGFDSDSDSGHDPALAPAVAVFAGDPGYLRFRQRARAQKEDQGLHYLHLPMVYCGVAAIGFAAGVVCVLVRSSRCAGGLG